MYLGNWKKKMETEFWIFFLRNTNYENKINMDYVKTKIHKLLEFFKEKSLIRGGPSIFFLKRIWRWMYLYCVTTFIVPVTYTKTCFLQNELFGLCEEKEIFSIKSLSITPEHNI